MGTDYAGGLKGAGRGRKGSHWWVWIYVAIAVTLIPFGALYTSRGFINNTYGNAIYTPCNLSANNVGSQIMYGEVNTTYIPAFNTTATASCSVDWNSLIITGGIISGVVALAAFWGLAWTAGKKYQNITHPIERGIVGPELGKS